MVVYCYETKSGKVVEKLFPMGQAPKTVKIGRTVARRSFSAESKSVPSEAGWPLECLGSGVNADQAGELRGHFKKHGLNIPVSSDGNPIYPNAAMRRKGLKCRNIVDRSSYI